MADTPHCPAEAIAVGAALDPALCAVAAGGGAPDGDRSAGVAGHQLSDPVQCDLHRGFLLARCVLPLKTDRLLQIIMESTPAVSG